LLLLVFLNSRAGMRRRYIFFSLVSIGDILDGFYLVYPSIARLTEMSSGTFDGGQWPRWLFAFAL
uniref:G_PROTEIN_RECEP_F1_2 domain-containing protein n=1 Tax=Heligmosomoides polygyrus TaxID=6339 RepID=A0A183FB27_HELPZ